LLGHWHAFRNARTPFHERRLKKTEQGKELVVVITNRIDYDHLANSGSTAGSCGAANFDF